MATTAEQQDVVCTIVAKNYLAHARTWSQSLKTKSPGFELAVLVLDVGDDPAGDTVESFEIIRPSDLALERREFHRMAAIYDVLELATALKPWLLSFLLDRGAPTVTYLDPDVVVFSPLDPLAQMAGDHAMVFTPHTLQPVPRDGRFPTELDLAKAGRFNLGFVSVSAASALFLEWWRVRLRRDCLYAVDEGMFVDQKWAELGSSFFGHAVVDDPRWNVAYWNLHERQLAKDGGRYEVDVQPLGFFHFSGFDPRTPGALSVHQRDKPRVVIEPGSSLDELCREYAASLFDNGYAETRKSLYGFQRAVSGEQLHPEVRRRYRTAVMAAESAGDESPPDPFDPCDSPRWQSWFVDAGFASPFGGVGGLSRKRMARRMAYRSLQRMGLPPTTIAAIRDRFPLASLPHQRMGRLGTQESEAYRLGVNVVGYLRAESGVGEIARLIVDALEAAGIPFATVDIADTVVRRDHPFAGPGNMPTFSTNLMCVNADMLPGVVASLGPEFLSGRRSIGVWAWELDQFPAALSTASAHLDEVWVYSRHAAVGVERALAIPVLVLPVPSRHRCADFVPIGSNALSGFVFLFTFDFLSVFERKNPLAIVEAFVRAFPEEGAAQLVIKSVNGHHDPRGLDRLRRAAHGRGDVQIRDGYVSSEEQWAMLAQCDAYVSLHRAEGFGLTMAEAMSLGKPVIATGYSGNLDFMDQWNSYLVPYELVTVPPGCPPYEPGAFWADPDIDAAAEAMRQVFSDRQEAGRRGARAQNDIGRRDYIRTAEFISARMLSASGLSR